MGKGFVSIPDVMSELSRAHWPTFRKNYLRQALEGLLEMKCPDNPRHPGQRYRLTKRHEKIAGEIPS